MAVLEYHVFSYCSNLKTLVIPNTVKIIRERAFYACSSLTEITIPDSVTTVERDAFGFCRSAKTISIGAGVATLGEMAFYRCFAVEQFVVSEANAAYRSNRGNLYSKDGKTLLQYAIGKTDAYFVVPEGVTAIGVYAFDKAVHLLRVELPKSVISVSGFVFEGCDALTDIVFADPTGWYAASSYADWQAQNGTYTDLSDSSYAASYIKEWYYKYWFKKV
ncbi:MAG: leucine-rich repeat domain-containing protein [Clostridia bacterium]|nr:leucine-rich repeat domain-containing protein [Clostridia bacterium]